MRVGALSLTSVRGVLGWIVLFGLAKLSLHLVTSSGYGYFRDELYYLACADHPAFGYVDQPPLSILFLWVVRHVFGTSPLALRLLPAVLGAATVVLVGVMAQALGGRRRAVSLAMTGALVAPEYLSVNHVFSMNAFDVVFWALTALVMIRIVDAARARLWILLSLLVGFGLLNKISVLWLGCGLTIGLILSPERRWLRTRWPWAAATLALAMFAPHIAWQIQHGWPTLEFIRNATGEKMVHVAPLDFLAGQISMMLPFTAPLWLAGLAYLLLHPVGRRHQWLGWTYLVVFGILILSGTSRSGYLAPAYTWLFAAGGVAVEALCASRRLVRVPDLAAGLLLLAGAIVAPLALPILQVDRTIRYARALGEEPSTEERKELGELGQFYADMHGWEEIVDTLVEVDRGLSAAERANARILAPDYGVAGAIDLYGRARGLPLAISGHNNYWLWGPRGWDGRVLIVVGGSEERLRARFEDVERAATIDCGRCMPYENGRPVWVCRGLRGSVGEAWGRIKHYD